MGTPSLLSSLKPEWMSFFLWLVNKQLQCQEQLLVIFCSFGLTLFWGCGSILPWDKKCVCGSFDEPLNICLNLRFHHNCRQESPYRVAVHHRYYMPCCAVWIFFFQMTGTEAATVENELSAVVLFIRSCVSARSLFISRFQSWTKGIFPVGA